MDFKQMRLHCFSPPVMLATFVLEVCFALWSLWRYRHDKNTWLVVALLVNLAIFQLAEFMVCGGAGLTGVQWSAVGYVAISLLPPIGVHLAYGIAGKRNSWVWVAYAVAAIFIAAFLFGTGILSGQVCRGNYVIFQVDAVWNWWFAAYYYSFVLAGLGTSIHLVRGSKRPAVKRALTLFAAGYVAFLLPTITVNMLDPQTLVAIPSIMCGFAVLLAAVVTFGVLPQVAKKRK